MSKFSSQAFQPASSSSSPYSTFEGGQGFLRPVRQELFLLAVNEMAEDKFYESAGDRQLRLSGLVSAVVAQPGGWAWLSSFVVWLRNGAQMRSASVMVAAEAIAALKGQTPTGGGLSPRQLVSAACVRADEPAEMLGYWLGTHGRKIPAPLKRGVADAAVRLYSERNALKYDGQSRAVRMGDVVDLTHPVPSSPAQSALFKALLDRRHGRDLDTALLPGFSLDQYLIDLPEAGRGAAFQQGLCEQAGWSWERVAGWLPGGLTAQVWETLIPTMGYMALLRNLRNFDQAGISATAKKAVVAKLSDPEQVAASRQFPYRFLSAWKATESMDWAQALEWACDLSVSNIPAFPGKTLVLIDTSGSMQSPVGGARSQVQCVDAAVLFGTVLASRNPGQVDLVMFADLSTPLPVKKGASILRQVEAIQNRIGEVGYSTRTWAAIGKHYDGHDRIVVLTDEQSHDSGRNPGCWMHFFNLAGYQYATAPPSDARTFAYGGFTDQMFKLLPLMEQGADNRWPWEQ